MMWGPFFCSWSHPIFNHVSHAWGEAFLVFDRVALSQRIDTKEGRCDNLSDS